MLVKQISVFVENTPGRLATLTRTLADHGINIAAVSYTHLDVYKRQSWGRTSIPMARGWRRVLILPGFWSAWRRKRE